MSRKQIKMVLEWLHVLLLLAIVLPVLYMVGMRRVSELIYPLYFADYLLLLPIIVIKKASLSCKKFLPYLGVCLGICVCVGICAWGIGTFCLEAGVVTGYILYMLLGSGVIALEAYLVRMNRIRQQKAKEEQDRSWKQKEYTLDKPREFMCIWFVLVYVLALNFASPEMCNIALFSTIGYLLLAIAYQYIDTIEEYLDMNDNVCRVRNIPYKRILGVGKYFLLSYLLVILLAIVPALLTVKYREYRDIRDWVLQLDVDYGELLLDEPEKKGGGDSMQSVLESFGPPKEPSILVELFFYFIGVIFLLFLIKAAIQWIRSEITAFAERIDEEEDKVEMLDETEKEERMFRDRRSLRQSKEEKIRREYRRYIRKHRKERPNAYETPTEIETAAGVADTMEGKAMHEQYEMVRYGNGMQ